MYKTGAITGTFKLINGSPDSGSVIIIPNSKTIIDPNGKVIINGRWSQPLDRNGHFKVVVPATDDETLEPSENRQFTVVAKLSQRHLKAVTFEVPSGAIVDLSQVTADLAIQVEVSRWLTREEFDTALSDAENNAAIAGLHATEAGVFRSQAEAFVGDASDLVVDAETAKAGAETAKAGAETAKTGSETAKAGAESARAGAEAAKSGAETARTGAEIARTGAETARGGAEDASELASERARTRWLVEDPVGTWPARPDPTTEPVVFIGPSDPNAAGRMLDGDAWINTAATDPPEYAMGLEGASPPEGVVTATVGVLYRDVSATNGATTWVKASGSSNTGWRVLYGDTLKRNIGLLFTPPTGLTISSNTPPLLRRVGYMVHMSVEDGWQNTGTFAQTLLGSLPVGFRPQNSQHPRTVLLNRNTGTPVGHVSVQYGTGNVYASAQATSSALSWNLSFPTEDPWPTSLPGVSA